MKGFNASLIPEEYRKVDGLIKWCTDSLDNHDCDSALWMLNNLYERYEHNIEQRLWVAWLYGNCYWGPTAWVLWNEFPDQDLVDPQRLEEWHKVHWRTLRYQTDCKWSKGHLPAMYNSYHSWLNGRLQHEAIQDDFDYMWRQANSWFKFGRYACWFYLQAVSETCGYSFDAPSLWLHDYSGSRSHRNGLVIAAEKYDWIDKKLDKGDYQWLEGVGREVKQQVGCTNFQLETMLCSYKKLARAKQSRYISYYTDRQLQEIEKTSSDGWNGVDWQPWRDSRVTQGVREKISNRNNQLNLF